MTILGILLTILKIIGIILLVLLLIVLAIILLVLFVPFRYRVHADKNGWDINAGANISWLLHMISVDVAYGMADSPNRGLTKDIRIFGISLFKVRDWLAGRKKKKTGGDKAEDTPKPEETAEETQSAGKASAEAGSTAGAEEEIHGTAGTADEAGKGSDGAAVEAGSPEGASDEAGGSDGTASDAGNPDGASDEAGGPDGAAVEGGSPDGASDEAEGPDGAAVEAASSEVSADAAEETSEEAVVTKSSPINRIGDIAQKIRGILINVPGKIYGLVLTLFLKLIDLLVLICEIPGRAVALLGTVIDKMLTIYGKITLITDFFFDDRTQDAIHFVLGQVGHLIGHIRPRKLSGYLDFGFDDPSWTGRVLGGLSLFIPQCGKTFDINPDFENPCFECDINSSGRIYLFYLAYIAVSTYFNKDIKYVLRYVKHLRKELSQAGAA